MASKGERRAGKGKSSGPFEALRPLKKEMEKEEEAKKEQARASGKKVPAPAPTPSAARQRDTRSDGPEDEALLLHRLFAGVEPLDRSRGGRVPRQQVERSATIDARAKHGREAARADADAVHEHLRTLVEGGTRFEVSDDGRRVEGRRVELPMDTVRKLRRGMLPVDARIDLHGLGAGEARGQLEVFLRTMRARGERCVLVIHGKGEHSPGRVGVRGVLRGEIAAWLSQGASSEHVAAFTTAQGDDGGEGAVYVLLRR